MTDNCKPEMLEKEGMSVGRKSCIRPNYPEVGEVYFAKFEGDETHYLCHVKSEDDLGNNIVEITLQILNLIDLTEQERRYDLISNPNALKHIKKWELLFRLGDDEGWEKFLALLRKELINALEASN